MSEWRRMYVWSSGKEIVNISGGMVMDEKEVK
jgi:hypothetical protein